MLYLEILKAKSELGGYIVNYFSKYFSSVVINGKKKTHQKTKTINKNPLITGLVKKLKMHCRKERHIIMGGAARDRERCSRTGQARRPLETNTPK